VDILWLRSRVKQYYMLGRHPYFKQKQTQMPDISMCTGGSCMLRLHCHRYTAKAEELGQSFFSEPPYKLNMMFDEHHNGFGVATLSCAYFWNNKEYQDERPKLENN
jgi:hypothetical protein